MEDSRAAAAFREVAAAAAAVKPLQLPEQEQHLRCPRCDSTDTKFCYYNNYNLSQPRYFCKSCRRYWTKGGALRNVPVGGGTRKNSKRSSSSSSASNNSKRSNPPKPSTTTPSELAKPEPIPFLYQPSDHEHRLLDFTGSFSSLLSSSNGFLSNDIHYKDNGGQGFELQSSNDSSGSENKETAAAAAMPENFLALQGDSEYWNGGWTDLAVYNPGSSFH